MGFQAWKYLPPVLGVLFCGQAISQPAANPGKNAPEVQLLVYNGAKIPERVMEQAGVEAVRIFAIAGIRLDWLSCPARGPEVCRLGNAGNRFVLHVLPREKASSDSAYGEAFLGDDGVGRYADAFFDRIEQTHRESRVDPSRLLGAVAAHELGHLLLGLRSHSWVGIMSPTWSGDNLKRVAMGTMYFTEDQSRRIKQRMLTGDGMRMIWRQRKSPIDSFLAVEDGARKAGPQPVLACVWNNAGGKTVPAVAISDTGPTRARPHCPGGPG